MTPADADLLAFESRWRRHNGTKEEAIRKHFGITPVRYYMLLRRAAESSEGVAADPLTARRVREIAQRRQQARERRSSVAHA